MINSNNQIKAIISIIFSFILSFCTFGGMTAIANTDDVVTAYESRNILDDLTGSTVGGVPFDLNDWEFGSGSPQIICLNEFCFSTDSTKQNDFGLYIYLFNPKGFDLATDENNLTLGTSGGSYVKYNLKFLNRSETEDYEGMFYKFKIELSSSQKQRIINSFIQSTRQYTISELELFVGGALTAYPISATYTYSGYANGYGDGTLSCTVSKFDKGLELEVTQTVYRPQGDYYNGEQSQLNSCFFTVPEKYFAHYGDLYKVLCEWYEYTTKPILVTSDRTLYDYLDSIHGGDIKALSSALDIVISLNGNSDQSWFGTKATGKGWASTIDLSPSYTWADGKVNLNTATYDYNKRFTSFAGAIYTDGAAYNQFSVSARQVEELLLNNSAYLGGEKYVGKYSEYLFNATAVDVNHAAGYSRKEITKTSMTDIFSTYTHKTLIQEILGGYDVEKDFASIPAMHIVTSDDLSGTDAQVAA